MQFFLGSLNTLHSSSNGVQGVNTPLIPATTTSGKQPGFNSMVGSKLTPHVIISALHDYTTVKILANPSFVVVDNQIATFLVGDQIPVQVQQQQSTIANSAIVNSIDYRSTGIILRVQPRINANGNVLLDIEQEISQCQNCLTTVTPTISDRRVKSSIMVPGGQTVLLAGLIQERQNGGAPGFLVSRQFPS